MSEETKLARWHALPTGALRVLLLAPLLFAVSASPLHAQTRAQTQDAKPVDFEALAADRTAKAHRYPMGRRISRYIEAASEELEAERPDKAEALLLRLDPKRLNPLERASVYRFLAYVSYSSDDPAKAIGYFEKVLDEEVLKVRDETKIRLNIAQLSAQYEDWNGVVRWIDNYVRYSQSPDPIAFYLKALAHFQLKQLDDAIVTIKKALEISPEPREAWLRLLATMHSQREDYTAAAPVFEELLVRFPKKAYWVQLSLIYGALEDYPRSLAVQQIAYAQGYLTEDKELQRLARSYLFHELPYPAAKVIADGLAKGTIEASADVYELLANSWIAAREYELSLPPLEKAAALAEDGRLYVRLAQVMMQGEKWENAAQMLEKALEKGGLEPPGATELLLGIAYYNSERYSQARSYFLRARKHEASRAKANNWITHLEREVGTGQS